MGVKMIADGFQSEMAAEFARKRALGEFLSDLAKEEKRILESSYVWASHARAPTEIKTGFGPRSSVAQNRQHRDRG
jgi:hypothetical protein